MYKLIGKKIIAIFDSKGFIIWTCACLIFLQSMFYNDPTCDIKNLIFLFLNQNVCCGYSKENETVLLSTYNTFKLVGK